MGLNGLSGAGSAGTLLPLGNPLTGYSSFYRGPQSVSACRGIRHDGGPQASLLLFICIMLFIGLEILTGIMMYYFKFPFSTQPIHLFLASLLFGAQSFFMIRIFKKYDFQN